MKKLINTLLDLLFIIGIIWLVISFAKWYKRLASKQRKLYWRLFLLYLALLIFVGL